jgi:hypothetical protein
MPRDGELSEQRVRVADLRRRATRVRRLMGGMTSKAEYDRLRRYADEMEIRAAELEKGRGPQGSAA